MKNTRYYKVYCRITQQSLSITLANFENIFFKDFNGNSLNRFKSIIDGMYIIIKNKGSLQVTFNSFPPKLVEFIENTNSLKSNQSS